MSDGADKSSGTAPALVAIPELLTRLSHEVRMLSDSVVDVQDLIGNLDVAGAFGGSHSLYELQCLDRISQSLEAVSACLGGASKLSSADWKINVAEASRGIKLAELCARLHGVESDTSQSGAGDFDDFALTG
jgi:hypothetical protein